MDENGVLCMLINLDKYLVKELQERASYLGANAIVAIDIDYETVGANGSMLMVAVSGTAVII